MHLLRRALEDSSIVNDDDKTIVMRGPLSEIYTQALNKVYAKDNDQSITPDTNGIPPANQDTLDEEAALEALKDKSTSTDKKKIVKTKKAFKPVVKKGSFHEWLGKKPGDKITDADIEKGLKSNDPHVKKMAQFAKNAKKWHRAKKGNKITKEEFTGVSLEEISNKLVSKIVLESQQMDVAIMNKMAAALIDPDVEPTDNFTTVYGTSKDSIDKDTVVDVTSELANTPDNSDFVMVIDATQPGDNSDSVSEPTERVIDLTGALECLVECHNGKTFYDLKSALEYIKAKK
jgi:hypothetical protein